MSKRSAGGKKLKDERSVSEMAMGHRYAYDKIHMDGEDTYPITDLRDEEVIAILVETTDENAALVVRLLNEAAAQREK